MRSIRRALLFLAIILLFPLAFPAHARDHQATVVSIRGVINPTMAGYVGRALQEAQDERVAAVVLEIDTPGGLDTSMRDIIQSIEASPVPVVGYVVPGGRAASAGAFIMMATHVAAMSPGSAMGAAAVVAAGGEELPDTLEQKAQEDAAALMRSLAEKRGRNVAAAERMVLEAKSYSASEALELGLVELNPSSMEALLQALHGRTVELDDERTAVLDVDDARVEREGMTLVEQFLFTITDPNIAFLLLSLAGIAIFFELANPGSFFPGVTGAIMLLLSFYALGTLQANWAGVLLILLAFALFIAEVFVTSNGILAIGGFVAFVLGALLLWGGSSPPGIEISPWVMAPTIGVVAVAAYLIFQTVKRSQKLAPVTGAQALVGRTATVRVPLEPEGYVLVDGELWMARTEDGQPVEAGQPVAVTRVEGLKLWVVPKPDRR